MNDRQYASTLGQFSWAMFEWGRNPYYILIVIYIFGPYFSTEVIGDPVRGQEIWGYINDFAGIVTACLAPFLGAVADKVGRRKPWIACFIAMVVPAILLLWLAVPGQAGWGIVTLAVALALAGTGFAFTEVFHNAMLPSVVPYPRLGRVSGWGLALGNGGALIILVFMLYCFALPASGVLDWGWLPDPGHVRHGYRDVRTRPDRRTHHSGLAGAVRPAAVLLHAGSDDHRGNRQAGHTGGRP